MIADSVGIDLQKRNCQERVWTITSSGPRRPALVLCGRIDETYGLFLCRRQHATSTGASVSLGQLPEANPPGSRGRHICSYSWNRRRGICHLARRRENQRHRGNPISFIESPLQQNTTTNDVTANKLRPCRVNGL